MPGRSEIIFAHSKIASQENLLVITNKIRQLMQEPPVFRTPAPLCKVHYHIVLQPTQTHCVTCGFDYQQFVYAPSQNIFRNT
jgi:hypothetical protein